MYDKVTSHASEAGICAGTSALNPYASQPPVATNASHGNHADTPERLGDRMVTTRRRIADTLVSVAAVHANASVTGGSYRPEIKN